MKNIEFFVGDAHPDFYGRIHINGTTYIFPNIKNDYKKGYYVPTLRGKEIDITNKIIKVTDYYIYNEDKNEILIMNFKVKDHDDTNKHKI